MCDYKLFDKKQSALSSQQSAGLRPSADWDWVWDWDWDWVTQGSPLGHAWDTQASRKGHPWVELKKWFCLQQEFKKGGWGRD
jgi:hypothetical protein